MTEAPFTWFALDALFEQKFGPACGKKQLDHEGYRISRSMRRQPSNSGKSQTWLIDFTVVKDGTEAAIRIEDPTGPPNRANDPSRNWGMGRE